jgi:hypothetical protein
MKKSILLLAFLGLNLLQAQYAESRLEVLSKAGGIPLFEVKDSTRLCVLPLQEEWFTVNGVFLVETDKVGESIVAKGTELFDVNKEKVGEVLSDMDGVVMQAMTERKFRNYTQVILSGAAHKTRFVSASVPELEIENTLKDKNRGRQDERFTALFENEDFEKREEGEFYYYVKRLDHCNFETEPAFRLILVLKGSLPYCVITNGTKFNAPKLKEVRDVSGYTFSYFQKPNERNHEQIVNVMYSYLPL